MNLLELNIEHTKSGQKKPKANDPKTSILYIVTFVALKTFLNFRKEYSFQFLKSTFWVSTYIKEQKS